MKHLLYLLLLIIPTRLVAETNTDSAWVVNNYTKREVFIPMRDGAKLCTIVYEPKDTKEKHPILMQRTTYSIAPYGNDTFDEVWNNYVVSYYKENYIVVFQDVRGKMMSEGEFEEVRPYLSAKKKKEIDEASDTYDTIEWLLKNTKNNNGKVGVWGTSYPGFYATMAALSQHPAVKAVSPQAPVTDWYAGDDFHHNGALMLMDAFSYIFYFGRARPYPSAEWGKGFDYYSKDNYKFYLETGSLANFEKLMGDSILFWKQIYEHPDYDKWWQVRNTRNYVKNILPSTSTLVVGGLYDAEDCYGTWGLYKAIEKDAHNDNKLVIGPWSHGAWGFNSKYLGNIRFGSNTSKWYQDHIEIPYFNYYLKGKGDINAIKEANIFFAGINEWKTFDKWPPSDKVDKAIYLQASGMLSFSKPTEESAFSKYTSDPKRPVAYTEDVHHRRIREYMTDDQRFASRRPDVLVFQTDTLTEDMALAGPVIADLFTAISTTDVDFVVKIIDVFPDKFKYNDSTDGPGNGKTYPMGGYQMLVRGEVMRGRYRNSLEHPEAFMPNEVTEVKYTLPDIAHVFKKGHRVMVQVQSTWFPLVDRNPQQYINIYTANENDYIESTIKIFHDKQYPSNIVLPIITFSQNK